jgi:DNA processing protein
MKSTNSHFLHWLVAIRFDNIGPLRMRRWLEHFDNHIEKFFTASSDELLTIGVTQQQLAILKNPDWQSAEQDFQWCEKNHCQIIPINDERYPKLLREISSAPLLLFVQGNTELLNQPQLAIVGSRNPTPSGRELAENFASSLAQAGLVVTSGMAMGIDAASHRGALAIQHQTIAVTGTGLKHTYPVSHRRLAKEIVANGALVSEFPPDTAARAQHFPMRNRIISGMSLGVLVVEAAPKSGSLITARLAMEQNRDVFAIPGSIHNPLARGCHQLIQQGAKLVESAHDILVELGALHAVLIEKNPTKPLQELSKLEGEILQFIGYEMTPLDAIIMRSGLTAAEVSSMLLPLELRGYVSIVPGGYVRNH